MRIPLPARRALAILAHLGWVLVVSCSGGQAYGQSTDLFDEPIAWESHFDPPIPFSSIAFADSDQKIIGKIVWADGTLRFEGDVDASARAFFEHWYKVYAGPCKAEP